MLNLKRPIELKVITAAAAIWFAIAPANAAIIDRSIDVAPVATSWAPQFTATHHQSSLPIVSTTGQTYHMALELGGVASDSFSNALFLSESLDSTDISRELTLADTSKRRQKVLFTQIKATHNDILQSENLRILPLEVEQYLKSMKTQWKGILGDRAYNGMKSSSRAVKNAISLNGAAHHVNTTESRNQYIISKEYGGVSSSTAENFLSDGDQISSIISLVYSQGALYTLIAIAFALSFLGRAVGHFRHA